MVFLLFLCSSINCMCFHFRSKEPGKDWREQLLCDPVNTSLHPSEWVCPVPLRPCCLNKTTHTWPERELHFTWKEKKKTPERGRDQARGTHCPYWSQKMSRKLTKNRAADNKTLPANTLTHTFLVILPSCTPSRPVTRFIMLTLTLTHRHSLLRVLPACSRKEALVSLFFIAHGKHEWISEEKETLILPLKRETCEGEINLHRVWWTFHVKQCTTCSPSLARIRSRGGKTCRHLHLK